MRRTACRLAREDPLSCFTHTIQLNNINYSFTLSAISLNASSMRNYSRQSVSFNTECHNHPSLEDPSHYKSGETSSVLKATSLQHWFKNWQEERKHKLTASTFAGAIGFFPKRRVQLWLEKLGTIEPFSGLREGGESTR
ncbi:hypothetical protein M5689_010183 [Euphorbia peplus]|nr:hypothetical protein M5689_010183 [Euphorbia peplus]